jgi:predicted Zn-dependent peptidase
MKKETLSNGLSVMYAGRSQNASVCLSVGVGHVNEPKLGIANLFERTLLLQVKGILPVFGGTMTAYTSGADNLADAVEKVSRVFNSTVITEEFVEKAKKIIIQQTLDTAPLTMRRAKLLYKHTAFGADLVRTTEEYISAIQSYTVEDLKEFANTYYVASNSVLVLAGFVDDEAKAAVKKYFSKVSCGEKQFSVRKNIYTGGFGRIDVENENVKLMFGWSVAHLTLSDSPAVNVMMSMFQRRLERAYAEAGVDDAYVEFKIAGYYGLRTMRAFVTSHKATPRALTDVFVKAVNRICDTEASDVRMERSRNAAMTEKLDKYERSDDAALEMAWQLVGRGNMYNVSSRINSIWETSARDVKDLSKDVFRHLQPTYIVVADKDADAYSYNELLEAIHLNDKNEDD